MGRTKKGLSTEVDRDVSSVGGGKGGQTYVRRGGRSGMCRRDAGVARDLGISSRATIHIAQGQEVKAIGSGCLSMWTGNTIPE